MAENIQLVNDLYQLTGAVICRQVFADRYNQLVHQHKSTCLVNDLGQFSFRMKRPKASSQRSTWKIFLIFFNFLVEKTQTGSLRSTSFFQLKRPKESLLRNTRRIFLYFFYFSGERTQSTLTEKHLRKISSKFEKRVAALAAQVSGWKKV